jgi:hypothetical protein|tara:strand:- start:2715 stop:2867 length:153 start_codon:yes stop_codon:yes gene_type:complete
MTADAAPREIRLDDYVPYPFSFDEVRVARRRRRDEKKKIVHFVRLMNRDD